MKLFYLIPLMFSLGNTSLSAQAKFVESFTHVSSSFITAGNANIYKYQYRHNPAQMNTTTYTNFYNGDNTLVIEIPTTLSVDLSRPQEFYMILNNNTNNKYYFDSSLSSIYSSTYTIPSFFTFNYTTTTDLTFFIPSTSGTPASQYNLALQNCYMFTPVAFRQYVFDNSYDYGYSDGYYQGFDDGVIDGRAQGADYAYDAGYDAGYDVGLMDGAQLETGSFAWLVGLFGGLSALLNIELFAGVTIGSLALISMTLTFLPFVVGLISKGGKD